MKKLMRGTFHAWTIGRKIKRNEMITYWEMLRYNSIQKDSWYHKVLSAAISLPTVTL